MALAILHNIGEISFRLIIPLGDTNSSEDSRDCSPCKTGQLASVASSNDYIYYCLNYRSLKTVPDRR